MDDLDSKIIRILYKDGRQSNSRIASVLGVSEGTVRARIKRLVEQRQIRRFTVEAGSQGFQAVVLMKTDPNRRTEEILKALVRLEGVKIAYEVSGKWDTVMIANCQDAEGFNELIESVRTKKGVIETESLIVLKTH